MSEFLAPINYDRARGVLRALQPFSHYTPQGAQLAAGVLMQNYPLVFERMERKDFPKQAMLLEMSGTDRSGALVFAAHLDAPPCEEPQPSQHAVPISVPLSRAHLVTLLEALDALLREGFRPGGDLLLALSADALDGGEGAAAMAAHLTARGVTPSLVLDYGGYATREAFKTFLPKGAPLALVGIAEKGELHGAACAEGEDAVRCLLRAGRRLTRRPARASLCNASIQMLRALGRHAPLPQRWLVSSPRLAFPLIRLRWHRRTVFRQFFVSERRVYALSAPGMPHRPSESAQLRFTQTFIPGEKAAGWRKRLEKLVRLRGVRLSFPIANDADARSDCDGAAWDALSTAVEIQFDRVVIVPCLSPYPTDAKFYSALGACAYRFSPFFVTAAEAESGLCTVTDNALQTAVQFFRSMLSV